MSVKKPMLVGGWTQPIEKKKEVVNMGNFPQLAVNFFQIFELPPPSMVFSHLDLK